MIVLALDSTLFIFIKKMCKEDERHHVGEYKKNEYRNGWGIKCDAIDGTLRLILEMTRSVDISYCILYNCNMPKERRD